MYQWYFNCDEKIGFNPLVLRDFEGIQEEDFKFGEYIIACKIIDEEGLEAFETMKIHVNGVVKAV